MRIVVSPHYSSLHDWLLQVPQLFSTDQGQLLYDGRNQIRLFAVDGQQLVVKRYKWFEELESEAREAEQREHAKTYLRPDEFRTWKAQYMARQNGDN
jgi:hypothetical protein